jgi:ER degradation enhancer, mannosidase alpha-like 2
VSFRHRTTFACAGLVLLAAAACTRVAPEAPATAPRPAAVPAASASVLAERVRGELRHAWQGYVQYAWGHDDLKPVSHSFHDWHSDPLLMTPVDAMDTLMLLGLKGEADRAHELIVEKLSFDHDLKVQNFEITIRILGGLLSGYQMTGDKRLLEKADDLGRRLLPVFSSPTGMPYRFVNLKTGATDGKVSNPAEIGTLLLEFGTLAKLTGKAEYYDKAKKAIVELHKRRSPIGLVGSSIDVETGAWTDTTAHLGGGIDSYYEYLLKCQRLFGDEECGTMWRESLDAINKYLEDRRPDGSLWYGEADMATGKRTARQWGALHAFFPAVLALGGDLPRARALEASSFKMWQHAGIEPELFDYEQNRIVAFGYPLRPEIIESAYYLHHYTKDPQYVDMGRVFLDSLVAHCRTDAGYAELKSVVSKEKVDRMHSFFLAETLKYLYLLFDEKPIDLDTVVFNTEAHPLRRTW